MKKHANITFNIPQIGYSHLLQLVHISPYCQKRTVFSKNISVISFKQVSLCTEQTPIDKTSSHCIMDNNKDNNGLFVEKLKKYVENVAGFKMCTPKDFDTLAQNVFNETGSQLSPTTLKRLWGYLSEKRQQTPRLSTMNILSKYIGYIDYATFCQFQNDGSGYGSDFLTNNSLTTRSLFKGDKMRLLWLPDRCVTVQYIGLCMFKVLESRNSKLSQNDTFICEHIVENQPLMLYNLVHENGDPVNYICGKSGGVKFQVLEKL